MIGLGLSLTRRRGVGVAARPASTLALDFIANPSIPPRFTFSRASGATYFDALPLMRSAGNDVARFEHDPASGSARGLLLETARSNVLTSSDAPETWAPYGIQVRTDGTLAPDGTTPARKICEDASNGVHAVSQAHSITTSNAVYSLWVRLKSAERSIAQVMLTDSASQDNCCANFDLNLCTVCTINKGSGAWSLQAASCVPMANGWAECRITGLVSSATTLRANVYLMQSDQLGHTYTGDGVSGLYFGGAQMEAGTCTSYIPATATSANRSADLLATADLSWLNRNEGTLLFDGAFNGVSGGGMFAFSLDDGSANGIGIYKQNGAGGLNGYSSSATGTPLHFTVADGQRIRAAMAWNNAGASASASINGGAAVPIVGANPVTPTEFCIGSARKGQFNANLWARSITYWPYRMTDNDLAALTALPPPSLSLDFATNPVIPPTFNFSRASNGTYHGADGLIHTAAPDIARFESDPLTLAPAGLLLEPASTNSAMRNSNFQSAFWPKNGTVTRTDGIDAPDGGILACRFQTANSTSGEYAVCTTVANTGYVASVYVRHVADGGTGTSVELGCDTSGIGFARFNTVTNALLSKGTGVTATGFVRLANGWTRYWAAYGSQAQTSMTDVNYGTTNYTFDAWGPQFEPGNYPTSYMQNNGAGVARAADLLSTKDLSWLDAQSGTCLFDGAFFGVADDGMYAFSLDDDTNNGVGIYKAGGSGALVAYSGTGSNGTLLGVSVADSQRFRAAIAWDQRGACASASANGQPAINIAGAQQLKPATLSIGSARNGRFSAFLHVRSLTYWPYRMDDASLAALTIVPPTQ